MDSNKLWYRDAVFYEVPVKSFFDSTNDGTGDFNGLRLKLPYLHNLGVDAIWLLPFYKSPLRDDGYDISDYYSIQPEYGTMDDFKNFIIEAHGYNIRVVADLVLNHVSDQIQWFQDAKKSRDSPKRDWFVWSDSDLKYSGVRIIFVDSETSNWTWEPNTKQYYWHRFYSHQPDLNYDNPEVREEMKNVIRYWLKMGLDGFRCDAVPYLFEREGTSCENLPETHAYFKEIRKMMDDEFPGTILLAEANQWPSDAKQYFGNGDEFQMAFNFPLMPRMFISLAKESSFPLINIINQTFPTPDDCDWAIFLRNHDELTLEMVTDEERDIMYKEYAKLPKMRLNLGIRRRLAPLVDNDRATLELLNALMLSLPGTPIIYYGDEIGMGDNVYLGDRNGVRTPMQWSYDRNAGFSTADNEQLYSPVVTNPNYHYESVNVESELRSGSSLLNWMKKMLRVRKNYSELLGRGEVRFIEQKNRRVLTYVREYKDQRMLCIFNLSRRPTYVELSLPEFKGLKPLEAITKSPFPQIGDLPYFFTLPPRGFFWLNLTVPDRLDENDFDD
ncbi:MAG: maltose alpha-D-glucosyltransferase [Thermoplasmatales archaeon B_DKE]|nr:MAG: maltose alpha-D-glucosyltransferase [Thermoplasmatales archaeon B_DKE]QRF76255.1 Malto-oligosyltrehalose trehalohydrolase [Thermoplasmatales archaeon]